MVTGGKYLHLIVTLQYKHPYINNNLSIMLDNFHLHAEKRLSAAAKNYLFEQMNSKFLRVWRIYLSLIM